MEGTDVWTYQDESQLGYDATSGRDLSGFHVEALDGSIGKIDESTYEVGKSFVIVDTGPWIFGRKVMLPPGWSSGADGEARKAGSNAPRGRSKNSPGATPPGAGGGTTTG